MASYGLDLLVAWYEYVRPDRTSANQPDVHTLRAECERFGIHYFVGAPGAEDLAGRTDAEIEARFAAPTDALAGSPSFLGWMFDEPVWRGVDLRLMERSVEAIRRHPARPLVWINLAPVDGRWETPTGPPWRATRASRTCSASTSIPWRRAFPGTASSRRAGTRTSAGMGSGCAAGWARRGPSGRSSRATAWGISTGPHAEGRRPSLLETPFMSLQALAYGASGLIDFPGARLGHAIPFDAPTWDGAIRETAASVQAIRPWLASVERAEAVARSRSVTPSRSANVTP